jgi:hypothetical protein
LVYKLLILLDYKGFKSGVYRGRIAVMVGCDSEAGEKSPAGKTLGRAPGLMQR